MAWGADVFNTFNVGYERGAQMKERAKKNKIAEILSQSYQAPQEAVPFQTDEEQLFGMPGLQGNVAQEARPGGFDSQNAIAKLYQGGFGPEAFQFEQQMQDRELGGLLKRAQINKALRPNLSEPKAGIKDGTEVFFRTDDVGNTYDLSGNKITGTIQPRPQKSLVNIDTGSKEADKEFIKETRDNFSRLRDAPTLLKNIEEAKRLIPQASQFMGTGGSGLLTAAKFLNNRMNFSINTEGVKSAEELRSRVFMQIMENLKKMDASPSQKQQEIMMDALGNLETDPNAMASILDAFGDAVRDKVETHNTIAADAEQRGTRFPHSVTIKLPPKAVSASPGAPKQYKLGDIIEKGGKRYRIIRLDPNGDHEVAPVR